MRSLAGGWARQSGASAFSDEDVLVRGREQAAVHRRVGAQERHHVLLEHGAAVELVGEREVGDAGAHRVIGSDDACRVARDPRARRRPVASPQPARRVVEPPAERFRPSLPRRPAGQRVVGDDHALAVAEELDHRLAYCLRRADRVRAVPRAAGAIPGVVGEDGVPPPGRGRIEPVLGRRLAGVRPAPSARAADGLDHLEQGVEVDAMTAGEHEDVHSMPCHVIEVVSEKARAHASRELPGPAPSGPGTAPSAPPSGARSTAERPGRRRGRRASGSAPSPGQEPSVQRFVAQCVTLAARAARPARRRSAGTAAGATARRRRSSGRPARAGEVQRVDEHGAVRLVGLGHHGDRVGQRPDGEDRQELEDDDDARRARPARTARRSAAPPLPARPGHWPPARGARRARPRCPPAHRRDHRRVRGSPARCRAP